MSKRTSIKAELADLIAEAEQLEPEMARAKAAYERRGAMQARFSALLDPERRLQRGDDMSVGCGDKIVVLKRPKGKFHQAVDYEFKIEAAPAQLPTGKAERRGRQLV